MFFYLQELQDPSHGVEDGVKDVTPGVFPKLFSLLFYVHCMA